MKRLISVFTAFVLLAAVLIPAVYAQTVDMERKGSITATMTYQGQPVPGGTLTVYRVASMNPADPILFHYVSPFDACNVVLDDLDFNTAVELATYVYYNNLKGLTKEIDAEGTVTFEDLEVGLYLLIQWDPAPGYYELTPFLISIPNNENGVYVYDTSSAPKQTPDVRPTEPPTEEPPTEEPSTEPPVEETTEPPTEPDKPKLPQTGLTNWPIPILTVCGVFFVTAGLVVIAKGRGFQDEC